MKNLSKFQFKILSHALDYDPDVRYVTYSTCSIYAEEDERVVADVLKKHGGRWRVAPNLESITAQLFKMKKDKARTKKDKPAASLAGAHITAHGIKFCHHCSGGLFNGFFFCLLQRK